MAWLVTFLLIWLYTFNYKVKVINIHWTVCIWDKILQTKCIINNILGDFFVMFSWLTSQDKFKESTPRFWEAIQNRNKTLCLHLQVFYWNREKSTSFWCISGEHCDLNILKRDLYICQRRYLFQLYWEYSILGQ